MKRLSRAIVALTGRPARRSAGRAELRSRLPRTGGHRGCAGISVTQGSAGRPV